MALGLDLSNPGMAAIAGKPSASRRYRDGVALGGVQTAHGRLLAAFARWLELAAAEPVRLPGVVWFERALISDVAERVIDRKSAAESVASLLNVVWRQDERRLRRDAVSFAAFRSLLQWLVDHQNAIALDLIGRLGGLM
jgi:hypothetical protein